VGIKKAIKNIKKEQIIRALTHVLMSIFAGTFIVAIMVFVNDPNETGIPLAVQLSVTFMSALTAGKAVVSYGFSWLIAHSYDKELPLTPAKLYWLYWVAAWFLTSFGII